MPSADSVVRLTNICVVALYCGVTIKKVNTEAMIYPIRPKLTIMLIRFFITSNSSTKLISSSIISSCTAISQNVMKHYHLDRPILTMFFITITHYFLDTMDKMLRKHILYRQIMPNISFHHK